MSERSQSTAAARPDRAAVVISTYNRPEFLQLVLEGYRHQDTRDFTIYIADDGSTESTARLIRDIQPGFPVPIRHIRHEDHGFRKARIHNLVLREVGESYVILTDGDCIPTASLVSTHLRLARPGCLITGSRILLSQAYSADLLQNARLPDMRMWALIGHRLHRHINRLLPILLPTRLAGPSQRLHGIHGCHMSCWRDDLLRINGFDESFEGWGREDSDLVARLFHAGTQRCNLRGCPVWHLWHPEEDRRRVPENDQLLRKCLEQKRIRAIRGIGELEEGEA
jgi:glycosyltransferase involved in cell wall biosynthesis